MPPISLRNRLSAAVIGGLLVLAAGCGNDEARTQDTAAGSSGASGAPAEAVTVRLGYFPNVTHAPALYGVAEGLFAERLGDNQLETKTFNAGPEAMESLLSGGLDMTFVGPNPAINAFARSEGHDVRIVAGSTSGGAFLVTRPDINGPEDLRGKTLATPQLGQTQDVALRSWLEDNGLEADTSGGGDVSIRPQANADSLAQLQQGQIDGAWVPEPWATRLVLEGGGKVLVDERTLWPEGRFVTTHLVVATEFLEEHPEIVRHVIEGERDAIVAIAADPGRARTVVNKAIGDLTGKPLQEETIEASFENLSFTLDPIAASLVRSAEDAEAVGLLDPVDLTGIYALDLVNEVLREAGEPPVRGL
ncbi:MAG: ABC transporter substrate-binding protein [Acidimicrobiia bacterium]